MSRTQRLGIAFSAFVAFAAGVMTLISLLLGDHPALFGDSPDAAAMARNLGLPAAVLLRMAAITIAFTIIIGILNLISVHVARLARRNLYSAVLLASFAFTIYWYISGQGDTSLLEAVQVPIESALAALLFIAMLQGGARILGKRADIWGLLFVAALLIVLLGSLPLASLAPLREWRDWLMAVPVSAGARAILLGIALATVVTGVRILLGQDRSYRG